MRLVMQCDTESFRTTFESSVFSFIEVSQVLAPHLSQAETGGSIITFTFNGSQRVVPEYGLMGPAKAALECSVKYLAAELGQHKIRVNAISPGPINTISARGIPHFSELKEKFATEAPLKTALLSQTEVAQAALFLASDNSRCISGQTLYVDNGYHVL